jgi:hypothetical protein
LLIKFIVLGFLYLSINITQENEKFISFSEKNISQTGKFNKIGEGGVDQLIKH